MVYKPAHLSRNRGNLAVNQSGTEMAINQRLFNPAENLGIGLGLGARQIGTALAEQISGRSAGAIGSREIRAAEAEAALFSGPVGNVTRELGKFGAYAGAAIPAGVAAATVAPPVVATGVGLLATSTAITAASTQYEKFRLVEEEGVAEEDAIPIARARGLLDAIGAVFPAAIGLSTKAFRTTLAAASTPEAVEIATKLFNKRNLLRSAASGTAINVALGGADRFIYSKALEDKGYFEAAEYYKVLDREAFTLDVLLGAAFGATGAVASRGAVSRLASQRTAEVELDEAVNDLVQNFSNLNDLPEGVGDEVFDKLVNSNRAGRTHAMPKTLEAVEAANEAFDTVIKQIVRGEKADVSNTRAFRQKEDMYDYDDTPDEVVAPRQEIEIDPITPEDLVLPRLSEEEAISADPIDALFDQVDGVSEEAARVRKALKEASDLTISENYMDELGQIRNEVVNVRERLQRQQEVIKDLEANEARVKGYIACSIRNGGDR